MSEIPEKVLKKIQEAKEKELTELDLRYSGLTALPESLGELHRLNHLFLNRNQLTELPESIDQLERLIQLRGDHNQLIDLPESMRHLQELTHLLLRNNQLTQLPKWIWQLMKLTQLDWRNNPIENLPPKMPGVLYSDDIKKYRAYFWPEIYISYAWGGESEEIANELDTAFQEKGIPLVRDKRDLGFKGRIKAFMEDIGRGKCVILVISKKYLESENCLFELVEIARNGDFYDRIFPIVLDDARIYKPVNRINYIRHWEDQIQELDEAMKSVSSAKLQGFREDIDHYTDIRNTIAELTNTLKDMNTFPAAMHRESGFAALIDAVEKKLAE